MLERSPVTICIPLSHRCPKRDSEFFKIVIYKLLNINDMLKIIGNFLKLRFNFFRVIFIPNWYY